MEFNILGCRVKLSPAVDGKVDPRKVIELVQREASAISESSSKRTEGEIAVLVALKMAADKLSLESEYRNNIEKLEDSVADALQFIEEVTPTTV